MNTITIAGVTYKVVDRMTLEDAAAKYPATARLMQANGQAEQLYLTRPRGRKIYIGTKFQNGTYHVSKPL